MKRIFSITGSWLFPLGLLLGFLNSCDYSYFDIDKPPDYIYSPVFVVPLVNSSLTISDLIPEEDQDLIGVGDDNLVSLFYRDHLLSASGGLFFVLPGMQRPANFSATPPGKNTTQTITRTFTFSTGNDDRLDSIVFKRGEWSVQVSAPGLVADGYQASVTGTIPGSYNQAGQPFTFVVNANATAQKSMEGYTIPFYSSGSAHNQFDVHYQVEFSGAGSPNNAPYTFSLAQNLSGMRLEKMFGFLAPRTLNLGGMGIDIGIFSNDSEGNISFEDPKVRIIALNSFGFNIDLVTNELYLENEDNLLNLTGFPNPWTINGPGLSQQGQEVITNFVLNRSNSNVHQGVEFYPEILYASFIAQLNPTQARGFVLDQSQLDITVEMELPLFGTANGFSLKDTIELSRNDSITEIEWVELVIDVVNGFPLDLFLQVEFTDSFYNVDMVLFEGVDDFNLIASGQVNAQGNVIAPERKNTRIILDEAQTLAFLNSQNMILSARMLTANQGGTPVKIYDNQKLDVRIGARIKGKVVIEF